MASNSSKKKPVRTAMHPRKERSADIKPIPKGYDMVNKPGHYQGATGKMQVVDVIEEFVPDDAHIAHALTYLLRAGKKPGSSYVLDLEKSVWWLNRAIAHATKTHGPK